MHWRANWFPFLLIVVFFFIIVQPQADNAEKNVVHSSGADCWTGAGLNQIPVTEAGNEIRYGRSLIENTSYYFGPKGTIVPISNGMNCQNCHLEAGTKPWGNNYGGVASTYPKFRNRSGTVEDIEKRVNDCFERSLNGHAINNSGREMKAIVAYIKWLGSDVPKNSRPKGSGIMSLPSLDRAADPVRGNQVYATTCMRCHGASGEGKKNTNDTGYAYPPLWGNSSYNTGAGMYRLSSLAGYALSNMPHPRTYHDPELTVEQAWDVAAYINSQPRPTMKLDKDWPDISKKPIDHPFGPYVDGFSEQQHKYGPWGMMNKEGKK